MTLQRAAFVWCLFSAALLIPTGMTWAAEPVIPKPVILLEPIVDSGGVEQKMAGGETLARRFTGGLRAALEGESGERFTVRVSGRTDAAAPSVVRFVLRGGLSRVQGEDEASPDQPYLCIIRLFQETVSADGGRKKRRLVGQWAGTARGLRDLTGNLTRDPRVHVLGLAGEFAERISRAAQRSLDPRTPVRPPTAANPGAGELPAVLLLEGGPVLSAAAHPKPASTTK
ncbi:MAG: hypothetical protein V4671_14500 [Armatimonadota bacterium]